MLVSYILLTFSSLFVWVCLFSGFEMMPSAESPLTAFRWFTQRRFAEKDKAVCDMWDEDGVWLDYVY